MRFTFQPDVPLYDETGNEVGRQSQYTAEAFGTDNLLYMAQATMSPNPDPGFKLKSMELLGQILTQQMIEKGVWSD